MRLRQFLLRCAGTVWFTAFIAIASAQAADQRSNVPVVLVVGDSLSAGYGVRVDATWVALLQKRLDAQGYGYKVVNASISGETTGGARTRLPRALDLHKPAVVLLELGANDGLRGLPPKQIRANFEEMVRRVQSAGAQPVLVAMRIPVNYGPQYSEQLHAMYADLGKQFSVPVIEGFLESVALDEKLMQDDGLHPNAQAQPVLLDVVWPALAPVLKK
jgi:acyl-CoA thioesterase-1